MVQVETSQLTGECNSWREKLRQYRDEFSKDRTKLQDSASRTLSKEQLQQVEHLHNQFHIQLINIHDLAILPEHRGRGIGRQLLAAVERKARDIGCCKLTLEVQENNHRARGVYGEFGFEQAVHKAEAGGALFLSKRL